MLNHCTCLKFVLLCCAILFSNEKHCPAEENLAKRPNIVLLFADDLGYGELGCQGNQEIPTPHIDSIAKAGVRFTSGYVTASYCSSSRAGLLTGKFQSRFGYEFNPTGADNEDPNVGLPANQITLAEHLKDAGSTTGLVGKWHLGGTAKYHPFRHGFDEFFGFLHEGHYFVPPPYDGVTTFLRRKRLPDGSKGEFVDGKLIYSTHLPYNEPAYDANNPLYRGGQPIQEESYLTDAFTREAVDFIGRNKNKPFFLYVAYNAVHSPMQGDDAYMKKFSHIENLHRRVFAAMLNHMDDSVGAVLNKLEAEKLMENTLIFFISDNGGPTQELTSSNLPLRAGKGSVYEGGIRVPFLAQWKNNLPAGKVYDAAVTSLDVYATAAEIAKAPIPKQQMTDGVNLLPYLSNEIQSKPHPILYWRMNTKAALRSDDWKLVSTTLKTDRPKWELYDLATDISESKDLSQAKPDQLRKLVNQWNDLNQQMLPPFWKPTQ